MQPVLDLILVEGIVSPKVRLRPQILGVFAISAKLQRDEVVLFIVARIRIRVAVFLDLRNLERVRVGSGWPELLRAAAVADTVRIGGAYRSRCAGRVGKAVNAVATSSNGQWQL